MTEPDATPEFIIEAMEPNHVVVRDVETGHRFTFHVAERPDTEDRILPGSGQVRIDQTAALDENAVARRVWNFAQFEMLKAGHVDCLLP